MGHPPAIISGTVRDSAGKVVPGARIMFTAGPVPLPEIAALTNERGEYALSTRGAGTYRILCVVDGKEPAEIETVVATESQQVDIQMS